MLVLSRQKDQSIVIDGKRITVTVIDIRGDQVRLGVTADKSISIHRLEVYGTIQRENRDAAGIAPPTGTNVYAEGTVKP